MSIRGLGIYNFENMEVSGESYFIKNYIQPIAKKKSKYKIFDIYWLLTRIKLRKFMILLAAPLISNIGFDLVNSSNTKTEKLKRSKRPELVLIYEKSVDYIQTIRNANKLSSLNYKRLVGSFGQNKSAYEIFRPFALSQIIGANLMVIWVKRYFRKSL